MSATRTLGQVANSLEESPVDAKRLTVLKLSLEEKLKTLKELNAEIIELVPEDDLEAEIQQADECQEKIFEALARIDHAALTPVSTSSATAADRGEEEPARTHSSSPKVKLPKLSSTMLQW